MPKYSISIIKLNVLETHGTSNFINLFIQMTSTQIIIGPTPSELALTYNDGITQEDHLYTPLYYLRTQHKQTQTIILNDSSLN